MKRSVLPIAVAVIAVLVVIGVIVASANNKTQAPAPANSDTTNTNNQNTPAPAPTPTPSTSESTAASTVNITDNEFSPASMSVKKGTKVTWTNKGSSDHTVTADSGTGPDSGTLASGKTYSYTYDTVGSFAYHCIFHSGMKGTITVTE